MNADNPEAALIEAATTSTDGTPEPAEDHGNKVAPDGDLKAAAIPEKREYPRYHLSWRAELFCRSPDNSGPIAGRIKEASPIGVTFLSDRQLIKGRKVILAIKLPLPADRPPIDVRVEALVVNSILSRTGFRSGLSLQNFLTGRAEFLKCFF